MIYFKLPTSRGRSTTVNMLNATLRDNDGAGTRLMVNGEEIITPLSREELEKALVEQKCKIVDMLPKEKEETAPTTLPPVDTHSAASAVPAGV